MTSFERDFMVGLRGYDKDEVRAVLEEVAKDHAALLAQLDEASTAPTPPPDRGPRDDFEELGAGIAAILRAAKGSAAEITGEAESNAATIRVDAEQYAETVRGEANQERERVTESARQEHQQAVEAAQQARAEGEQILAEAREHARAVLAEAEERVAAGLDEARQREADARGRLTEATDALNLALKALDQPGPAVDLRHTVHHG